MIFCPLELAYISKLQSTYHLNYSPEPAKKVYSVWTDSWFCLFSVFIQSFVQSPCCFTDGSCCTWCCAQLQSFSSSSPRSWGQQNNYLRLKCWLIVLLFNCTHNSSDTVLYQQLDVQLAWHAAEQKLQHFNKLNIWVCVGLINGVDGRIWINSSATKTVSPPVSFKVLLFNAHILRGKCL